MGLRDIKCSMRKVLKRLVDFIFYVIVILIVLALLFVLSYSLYFQSSLTKVISGYPGMGDVRIEFDKIDTDIFTNYPHGNINLENFKVIDASNSEDESFIVNVKQISLDIKNSTWQDKRLLIRDVRLDSGEIFIHRDSLGNFNFSDIFNPPKSNGDTKDDNNKWSVDTDSLRVNLNDMLLSYVTEDKHQSIITSVKKGEANIYSNEDGSRTIRTLLDLNVIDFTLKQGNGSFLKNANVSGPIDIHLDHDAVEIEQSTLAINSQEILASAVFYKHKEKYSYLHFINNNTDFEVIKLLLSPKLQETLEPYKADGQFKADATLTLMPTHPLRVDIDYVFPGNTIHIRKQIFYNAKLSGHFVNDKVYDRKFNKIITDKGYVRFDIDAARTVTNDAEIHLRKAVILAGKGHPATIVSDAIINGKTDLISSQLKNENFVFDGGEFEIDAKLKGQLNNFKNLIEESDLSLTINKCNVQYLPSEVVLPLQTFHLSKESGDADFNIIGLTADEEYGLALDGRITNLMEVINGNGDKQSTTNVKLKAKRLSWEDFVNILGEGFFNNKEKTPLEKRRDMKKTLKGFQDHFQPNIYFEIDTSGYYDYT
ncbi:AsmA family protein, partial [Saprospiraceae bacterium]|nr:AsmA family protein [Saprospiraceae bacterium]